jgi:hypothetical protein
MTNHHDHDCGHDRPETLLAEAMAEARGIVARLRDAEPGLEPNLRDVARTVARLCEERGLLDKELAEPLETLVDGLDRAVAAGARRVSRAVLRGSGPDGDVYDMETGVELDERAQALTPIRDALRRTRERLERVRDVVAADQAINALNGGPDRI